MPKKLVPEQLNNLLECGIREFAAYGLDKANINNIAKNAQISVGVLYKYYENKDDFFRACLEHSMESLSVAIVNAVDNDDKMLVRAEKLIRAIQISAKTQGSYHALYQELTSGRSAKYAAILAREIEQISAGTYSAFILEAQNEGAVRSDISPQMLAFLFDNLLMMLQFSYCCDYYRERLKIYLGEEALQDDELMVRELLKFLESAFTFEQGQVEHAGAGAGASADTSAKRAVGAVAVADASASANAGASASADASADTSADTSPSASANPVESHLHTGASQC